METVSYARLYHHLPVCSDKGVCAVVSHGSKKEKLSAVPGLASFNQTVGSAQSVIQNKQVEALITGTSPPIVALIPSAGGGGRWEGMVTRPFLTF